MRVITIDGPAGAGKSTVARKLAEELGYLHLDSGALTELLAMSLEPVTLTPQTPAS